MSLQVSTRSIGHRLPRKRDRLFAGIAPAFLRRLLSCIELGSLVVELPTGECLVGVSGKKGPEATLVLHRWRGLRRLATGGDLAFAESYIDGDWSSPDLTALIELAVVNTRALQRIMNGFSIIRLGHRIAHRLRANTRQGSRRNIAFHYDLGNDFYALWLDRSMTYSSALYTTPTMDLEGAQEAKLDRVAALLDLREGQDVLEIGCGWGALAARIASQASTKVTALTLSGEQQKFARESHRASGLSSRVDVRLEDYRDVVGQYDRIVSIEMLEAVGEKYWSSYFDVLRERLKGDGHAVLQVITIDETRYEDYREGADFIQRYVFPGGMLPSKTALRSSIEKAGLSLDHAETFGASYAATLAEWRVRFHRAWPDVEKIGFPDKFRRLWDYYLCYCEAGFRTGAIDVGLYCVSPPRKESTR